MAERNRTRKQKSSRERGNPGNQTIALQREPAKPALPVPITGPTGGVERLLRRAHDAPASISPAEASLLQRSLGNQNMRQLAAAPVSARAVPSTDRVRRSLANLMEQRTSIRRKEVAGADGGPIAPKLEQSIQTARNGGQPLARDVRQSMESTFGADFSGVKVHSDARSDMLNRSLQARAFTAGQDIFFRQGEYRPESSRGQQLLAHELTHTVQQGAAGVKRQILLDGSVSALRTSRLHCGGIPVQRQLMSAREFKKETSVKRHRRKRIAKIDALLKKIEQSGADNILLSELLQAIDHWLSIAEPNSLRRPGTEKLRAQVVAELDQISQNLSAQTDSDSAPQTRGRSKAFSAEVTGAGKTYKGDFSDFDSKQFRVSGRAPNRKIEEVKRTQKDGKVTYYAMGLVTSFKGSAPVVAPYPEPVSLGDWYPSVTHINGMAVAPKSGILSAAALQEAVSKAIGGNDDVALGQEAVDVLYTYSAKRGGLMADLWDCIKGKAQVRDLATEKQEQIMLDAVHRKKRVTVSAHSRGTIKTDNAVRNVHRILSDEYLPLVRQESYRKLLAYWKKNDPGIGLGPELLAEMSLQALAKERAKEVMNSYIQLIYAGNAVQYPSSILKVDMYVGGLDFVSMFVGTYSETGRAAHAAIGIGGSTDSRLHGVGKTKGHGFVGNYVPAVGQKIAGDLKRR